jgi:hypothetical protein
MITNANQVYDLINRIIREARAAGSDDIAKRLDDAMCLGSSGLEILGAIKSTILAHRNAFERLLAPSEIDEIVRFVNRAFGTE